MNKDILIGSNYLMILEKNKKEICDDYEKKSLEKIVENIFIDYPVRIHWMQNCTCKKVKSKLEILKIKPKVRIAYVLTKLWDDEKYKNLPNFIHISVNECDYDDKNAKLILKKLFTSSLESRNYVIEYFRKYIWSEEKSVRIRKIVNKMTSVCFCLNNLTINESTCNAGFAVIGSKSDLLLISHCFNKYVKKTEFDEMSTIKVSDLHHCQDKMAYNLKIFYHNKSHKIIGNDMVNFYTLLGKTSHEYLDKNEEKSYSLAFGKREWCANNLETSFECAKRELYEEFNIQFSSTIWDFSESLNLPKKIHKSGFLLYFLYLPYNLSVKYHKNSDTILLDIKCKE